MSAASPYQKLDHLRDMFEEAMRVTGCSPNFGWIGSKDGQPYSFCKKHLVVLRKDRLCPEVRKVALVGYNASVAILERYDDGLQEDTRKEIK